MISRNLVSAFVIATVLLLPSSSTALTLDQFIGICEAEQYECTQHPIANAYVGGALDLIATLDEETDYLETIYCKKPRELFDVPAIIRYMQQGGAEHAGENAMILVLQYLQEHGGC